MPSTRIQVEEPGETLPRATQVNRGRSYQKSSRKRSAQTRTHSRISCSVGEEEVAMGCEGAKGVGAASEMRKVSSM